MRLSSILKTCLVTASLFAVATAADARGSAVRIGTLSCNVAHGWGHVVASDRRVDCRFRPSHGYAPERYTGTLSRYGVDLGYTRGGAMVWAVVAPTTLPRRGALAGNYMGASADATAGVGLGANVLLGGFHRSITLQPLSVEGNTGLAVAAGAGILHLRAS